MKALIQRVERSSVSVDDAIVSEIHRGFLVLLGVRAADTEEDARFLAQKTANLRIFADPEGKMNLSLLDIRGAALVVSQFTLYADTRKGNRPSFVQAAPPEKAEVLYNAYVDVLRRILGADRVSTGVFRAMMTVHIVNQGPVTIELNSDLRPQPHGQAPTSA